MSFLQKSKKEQIQDAIKGNAELTRKAKDMIKYNTVDKKFQRFLIEDQKRLDKETEMLKKKLKDLK
jgi:hypothetical protein